jgi:hypothetical protein
VEWMKYGLLLLTCGYYLSSWCSIGAYRAWSGRVRVRHAGVWKSSSRDTRLL